MHHRPLSATHSAGGVCTDVANSAGSDDHYFMQTAESNGQQQSLCWSCCMRTLNDKIIIQLAESASFVKI